MKKRKLFYKFMIFLATLSLILVALAPVVYVLAPQVAVTPVDEAVGETQPEFVEIEPSE